jgi:hypothetical protein
VGCCDLSESSVMCYYVVACQLKVLAEFKYTKEDGPRGLLLVGCCDVAKGMQCMLLAGFILAKGLQHVAG